MNFPSFFEAVASHVPEAFEDHEPGEAFDGDAEGYSAPAWMTDPPRPDANDLVVPVEVGEVADPPGTDTQAEPMPMSDGESGYAAAGSDAIACYVPFHWSPAGWGIYFFQRPFFRFVDEIAQLGALAPGPLAPVVLRQVLFHELTHFQFEVVGTELEDVLGPRLYLDYLQRRFGSPAAGLGGPLEETLATWGEVRFARDKLPGFLRPKPASYPAAVAAAASAAPPGYNDWSAAGSPRRREQLVAAVASLIADQPITTGAWGKWLSRSNRRSVPKFWVGDPHLLPHVGALQKSDPQVALRVFERWLRAQGIQPIPARGSHQKFEYGGQWEGYGTSQGRLLRNDAKRLFRFFGYSTMADFLIAVANKQPLGA